MNLESLCEPLSGDAPVGVDCESEIQSQNFALMTDYLVERAIQKGRERAAERTDLDEGEARNAASVRDEGKRRLLSLEGILKDALKLSTVNVEQVGKLLRDKTSAMLAQRGKDLRLVPPLAAACTLTDGLAGYAAALKLAAALLQAYPQELHPLPDEDEPADVWKRANAISDLLSGDGIHALLGPVVVIDAKQSGRLTLADLVGGLHNDIPMPEVSQTDLDMALNELGAERVAQLLSLLRDIEASIAGIVQAFDPGVLSTLRLADTFKRTIVRVAAFSDGTPASASSPPVDSAAEAKASALGANPRAGLHSREDARRAIQDVIRFIEKLEPGHPAPLLLKRADRLLGMGFFEIIKDMAPNALSDIERIVGAEASQ